MIQFEYNNLFTTSVSNESDGQDEVSQWILISICLDPTGFFCRIKSSDILILLASPGRGVLPLFKKPSPHARSPGGLSSLFIPNSEVSGQKVIMAL